MLFHLDFTNNTILYCFFFFFLVIDLYFLIPAVIAQIFILTGELVIAIGILEVKTETEIHLVTVETKIRKLYFRVVQTFLCFLLISLF